MSIFRFPIRDSTYENITDTHIRVAPYTAQSILNMECAVCKEYSINGVMLYSLTQPTGLYIDERNLLGCNEYYYYVPHTACQDLFKLNPLAYEQAA